MENPLTNGAGEYRPNPFARNKDTLQGVSAAIGIPIALVGGTYGVCSWYFGEGVTREVTLRNLPLIGWSFLGLLVVLFLALVKVARRVVAGGLVAGGLVAGGVWVANHVQFGSNRGDPSDRPPESVTNSRGMTFVRVDDRPGRKLPAGVAEFLLMSTKVTQKQLRELCPTATPSYFSAAGKGSREVAGEPTDDWPAESQTYPAAVAAARALSDLPAERDAGRSYRLPTAAEFAAALGDDPLGGKAHLSSDSAMRRLKCPGRVTDCPDRFGLFGMVGNVREWVACDCPAGKAVALGGSYAETRDECHLRWNADLKTSPARPVESEYGLTEVGFRFVCELKR